MRRYILYRVARTSRILNQDYPTNERAGLLAKSPLAIGRPEVVGGPDGFLCAIVEVVAEGRTNLTLEFKCRDQTVTINHDNIP